MDFKDVSDEIGLNNPLKIPKINPNNPLKSQKS
jgi:hypothetical protein